VISVRSPLLSADAIRQRLTTRTLGSQLIVRGEIDSTNRAAAALAANDAPHGTVLIADAQTQGRGRLGRSWLSPPGMNLYVSIVLRRSYPPSVLTWLPLVAALAVLRTIQKTTVHAVQLKWPNDVVVDHREGGRKLAGVLVEATNQAVIIGIGVNVNMPIDAFSDDLRSAATSLLIETGQATDRAELLAQLLWEAEQLFEEIVATPELSRAAYRTACQTLGKQVRVELAGREQVEGAAEGIAADGALQIRMPDGRLLEIRAGDVVHLR
jgi:BirA family biotin operon repressor/biotin-[acetyl-CoA-carboxylase] ligase